MKLKHLLIEITLDRMIREATIGSIPAHFVIDDAGKVLKDLHFHGNAVFKYSVNRPGILSDEQSNKIV